MTPLFSAASKMVDILPCISRYLTDATWTISAGNQVAAFLWPVFWAFACGVVIVLPITVAPPLRRNVARYFERHPSLAAALVVAFFSMLLTYLLVAWALTYTKARISMLMDGQTRLFFNNLLSLHGHLLVAACVGLGVWIAIQVAAVAKVVRMVASRRRQMVEPVPAGAPSARWIAHRADRWQLFLAATAVGIAVLIAIALRLYPAQKALERDAAAVRASLTRSVKAENQIQNTRSANVVSASLAADASFEAWISCTETFDAALQARNRRLHQLEWTVGLLVAAWLVLLVEWLDSTLRKPTLRQT
ncbi:MAG: hypothetical protein ACP5O1_08530 [Phycisphaerae bacterium]